MSQINPRYIIHRELGQGATARIFEVEDSLLGRRLALKQLVPPALADQAQIKAVFTRFSQEGRTLASLKHPHIPQVIDLIEYDGVPAIVMELIQGEQLYRYAQQTPPVADLLEYLSQVADALHYSHTQGIIHRDIKPDNILITADGAKLLDFGVARHEGSIHKTTDGSMLGTIAYMAPEQLVDSTQVDARSDIYSLGVLMYELLTGQLPFDGDSPAAVILKIFNAEATPPLQVNPHLHPGLAQLINRCLSKEPDGRIQSARQLQYALNILVKELRGEPINLANNPHVTQPGLTRLSLPVVKTPTLGELEGLRLSKAHRLSALAPFKQPTAQQESGPITQGHLFHNYELLTHLQMAIQEGFSGTLLIKAQTTPKHALAMQGAIWLEEGQICHAEVIRKDLEAASALYELLCHENGYFQKVEGGKAPQHSLQEQTNETLVQQAQDQLAAYQQLSIHYGADIIPIRTALASMAANRLSKTQQDLLALVDNKRSVANLQTYKKLNQCEVLETLYSFQAQGMINLSPFAVAG